MDEIKKDAAQSRKETKQLFSDVIRRTGKADRIPLLSNDSWWKVNDFGGNFTEALYDYDTLFKMQCDFHELYHYDTYLEYCVRNCFPFTDAIGGSMYTVSDNPNSIIVNDHFHMEDDEYDEIVEKGLVRYLFETLVPRQCGYTSKEDAFEHYKKAAPELLKYYGFCGSIAEKFREDYGVPDPQYNYYQNPFECLPQGLRGLKKTSLDLRRRPDKILEVMEALDGWDTFLAMEEAPRNPDDYIFDSATCPMAYVLLSPKQFEKFFWPRMKRYFDWVAEHDQIAYVYSEGSFKNKVDFFRDLEPGHFAFVLEDDDPVEMKQALPNATMIGGYPSYVLGTKSVEENLTTVKKMMEVMAADGNYIYSENKYLTYASDAKRENLLAILDYIRGIKL